MPPQGGEPPLDQPWYGIGFGGAIKRFFKKYATFSGRASRGEYWWWVLLQAIIGVVLGILIGVAGTKSVTSYDYDYASGFSAGTHAGFTGFGIFLYVILMIWELVCLVPGLALVWRRFHDTNHSGGFAFLALIPFVGGIIVLIFMLLGPDPAGARFDAGNQGYMSAMPLPPQGAAPMPNAGYGYPPAQPGPVPGYGQPAQPGPYGQQPPTYQQPPVQPYPGAPQPPQTPQGGNPYTQPPQA
ncbi:MAG: DUF805 domain-containing protein [Bifidobacteriaceae bacterium]|jgi:uncharacterized membrane protein YhaH (DUF805 family)|nr:DUF805 domain-containing protein [Bifidobacteriaceae bacterium]